MGNLFGQRRRVLISWYQLLGCSGAFGFSFSMADLKLLKEVKSLPKLSLASSHLEYFDWEESLEDFFWDRPLQQSEIYYAEKTLANDVFYWWIDYDKEFLC